MSALAREHRELLRLVGAMQGTNDAMCIAFREARKYLPPEAQHHVDSLLTKNEALADSVTRLLEMPIPKDVP